MPGNSHSATASAFLDRYVAADGRVVYAGAGIRGGNVYGETDRIGAYVKGAPVRVVASQMTGANDLFWNNNNGVGPWWEVPAPVQKLMNGRSGWTQAMMLKPAQRPISANGIV